MTDHDRLGATGYLDETGVDRPGLTAGRQREDFDSLYARLRHPHLVGLRDETHIVGSCPERSGRNNFPDRSSTTLRRFELRSVAKMTPGPSSAEVIPSPCPPSYSVPEVNPEMSSVLRVCGSISINFPVRPPGTSTSATPGTAEFSGSRIRCPLPSKRWLVPKRPAYRIIVNEAKSWRL